MAFSTQDSDEVLSEINVTPLVERETRQGRG
mgnify:CR=1 FL=1